MDPKFCHASLSLSTGTDIFAGRAQDGTVQEQTLKNMKDETKQVGMQRAEKSRHASTSLSWCETSGTQSRRHASVNWHAMTSICLSPPKNKKKTTNIISSSDRCPLKPTGKIKHTLKKMEDEICHNIVIEKLIFPNYRSKSCRSNQGFGSMWTFPKVGTVEANSYPANATLCWSSALSSLSSASCYLQGWLSRCTKAESPCSNMKPKSFSAHPCVNQCKKQWKHAKNGLSNWVRAALKFQTVSQ